MSTALAIASVTAVLRDLLNNGFIDHDVSSAVGGPVMVTALPPDRIDTASSNQPSQLNLFLYQVTPNAGWRNVGLPSRDGRGERLTNPPLALDLHYLLTAYGAEQLHGEILLGYGMQLMHETPVLPRELVRKAITQSTDLPDAADLPPALRKLFDSGLADQVEQIKITPQALSTEEISKLWAAFQAKYRPTAAYHISVVLIENRQASRSALPVQSRQLYVTPATRPRIERVLSQTAPGAPILADQPILAGHRLVLSGIDLRGDLTTVTIGGIDAPPIDIEPSRITVALPGALLAGTQGAQVVHRVLMGSPPTEHRGVESNLAAFDLRPSITATVTNVQSHGTLRSATVGIVATPPVGPAQRVVLLLNETSAPAGQNPAAYSFVVRPHTESSPPLAPTPNLTVDIDDVQPGTYLVRLQVDGAESPLVSDATGRYVAPALTIP